MNVACFSPENSFSVSNVLTRFEMSYNLWKCQTLESVCWIKFLTRE